VHCKVGVLRGYISGRPPISDALTCRQSDVADRQEYGLALARLAGIAKIVAASPAESCSLEEPLSGARLAW
jgi:hypothetical protein